MEERFGAMDSLYTCTIALLRDLEPYTDEEAFSIIETTIYTVRPGLGPLETLDKLRERAEKEQRRVGQRQENEAPNQKVEKEGGN